MDRVPSLSQSNDVLSQSAVVVAVNGMRWLVWAVASFFSISTFCCTILHGVEAPVVLVFAVLENALADAIAPAMIDAGTVSDVHA